MDNDALSQQEVVFRRPRSGWVVAAMYAIGGCIAFGSLLIWQNIGLSILVSLVLLLVLAALRPRIGAATGGAILFTWTPLVLATIAAIIGVPEVVEHGYEPLLIMMAAIFGLYATPVVVVVSIIMAGLIGLIAPLSETPPGHCAACNYNLRGLTSNRCPECGTQVASMSQR